MSERVVEAYGALTFNYSYIGVINIHNKSIETLAFDEGLSPSWKGADLIESYKDFVKFLADKMLESADRKYFVLEADIENVLSVLEKTHEYFVSLRIADDPSNVYSLKYTKKDDDYIFVALF